jgi:hypothetical protein
MAQLSLAWSAVREANNIVGPFTDEGGNTFR